MPNAGPAPFLKIGIHPKNECKALFEVHVDGESVLEIHRSLFGRNPSLSIRAYTLEEFREQFLELEYRAAKQYALRLLAQRAMLSNQLKDSMTKKKVSLTTAEKVIAECQKWGYLDDESWTKYFVKKELRKHQSPTMIAKKLQAKGLSQQAIAPFVQDLSQTETESIQHLLETRYHSRDLSLPKEKQKVIAALYRKGFALEEIFAAMDKRTCN